MKLYLMFLAIVVAVYFLKEYIVKKNREDKKRLPEGNQTIVRSFTSDDEYRIDGTDITCTCPDFQKRRSSFKKTDPRRLCKHLLSFATVSDSHHLTHFDQIIEHLKEEKRGFPIGEQFTKDIRGQWVSVFMDENRQQPWIRVFTLQDSFGYNIFEDRWSYGEAPSKPVLIANWISNCWYRK